jgi:hypothetical protein
MGSRQKRKANVLSVEDFAAAVGGSAGGAGTRQKRQATVLPAAHYEETVGGSAGSAVTAYIDLCIGPRLENGVIVPRHHLIFYTVKNKVIHLTVEETVPMRAIFEQIEEFVGYAVTLHQTLLQKNKPPWEKEKNVMLNRSDIVAEQGMDFGYSVMIKPVVPEKAINPGLRLRREHSYIPGVLRAGAPPADDAKSAKKAKQAKEPDPPADEPASDGEPRRTKRHGRPIPAWAPRGVPGATAQLPRKYDEDGNLLPTEYQHVHWHQGM